MLVGNFGFRGDDYPARVFVQAVDDTRPTHPADSREGRSAVCDQRIDQGSVWIAGRRVDNQSRRFVYHDKVLVLVEDLQIH